MTSSSDPGIILDTVSWVFFVIALIVCCIRLYADFLILHAVRLDTYIASVTFLAATTSQIFTTLSVYHGMGQHFNSLNPAQIKYSLKRSWMAQISQLFANTPLHGGDRTILTSVSERTGRVKTYASVAGRKIARQTENDDIAEDTGTVEKYEWFELTGNVEGDEEYEGIAK